MLLSPEIITKEENLLSFNLNFFGATTDTEGISSFYNSGHNLDVSACSARPDSAKFNLHN